MRFLNTTFFDASVARLVSISETFFIYFLLSFLTEPIRFISRGSRLCQTITWHFFLVLLFVCPNVTDLRFERIECGPFRISKGDYGKCRLNTITKYPFLKSISRHGQYCCTFWLCLCTDTLDNIFEHLLQIGTNWNK